MGTYLSAKRMLAVRKKKGKKKFSLFKGENNHVNYNEKQIERNGKKVRHVKLKPSFHMRHLPTIFNILERQVFACFINWVGAQ